MKRALLVILSICLSTSSVSYPGEAAAQDIPLPDNPCGPLTSGCSFSTGEYEAPYYFLETNEHGAVYRLAKADIHFVTITTEVGTPGGKVNDYDPPCGTYMGGFLGLEQRTGSKCHSLCLEHLDQNYWTDVEYEIRSNHYDRDGKGYDFDFCHDEGACNFDWWAIKRTGYACASFKNWSSEARTIKITALHAVRQGDFYGAPQTSRVCSLTSRHCFN